MSNEIIKAGESFLPQLTGESLSIEEVKEELDGAFLTFGRVKINGSEFEVDDGVENKVIGKELVCVIAHKQRVGVVFDDNDEVEYRSNDDVEYVDVKTGDKYTLDTLPVDKKEVNHKRDLYILQPGDLLPKILSLPITSAIKLDKWVASLLAKGIRPSTSIVRIGIEIVKKDKNTWSQATFERVGEMTPSDIEGIKPLTALAREYASREIKVGDTDIEADIEAEIEGGATPLDEEAKANLPF
jgi:hypothetical protein